MENLVIRPFLETYGVFRKVDDNRFKLLFKGDMKACKDYIKERTYRYSIDGEKSTEQHI